MIFKILYLLRDLFFSYFLKLMSHFTSEKPNGHLRGVAALCYKMRNKVLVCRLWRAESPDQNAEGRI